jgi:hypothetical protein
MYDDNEKPKNDHSQEPKQRWEPPTPPTPPQPPTPPDAPRIFIGRVSLEGDEAPDVDVTALKKLLTALESLIASTRDALASNQYEGTGAMIFRGYERHVERARQLLPDDDQLEDIIESEFDRDDERTFITQVQFALQQLHNYLLAFARQAQRARMSDDVGELRNLGKQMGDHIMNITKNALSRAMSGLNVDIDLDFDDEHEWDEDKNFAGANMKGKHYDDEDFTEANLMGAELAQAHFNNCDFTEADLTGADLRQAVLKKLFLCRFEYDGGQWLSGTIHQR